MYPAGEYEDMIADIKCKYGNEVSKTICILIANPRNERVQNEILNDLNYAHERSGEDIVFFFAGYSKHKIPDRQQQEILDPDGNHWYFYTRAFVKFIDRLEEMSTWKYSGEPELLLLEFNQGSLDFNRVINIRIYIEIQKHNIPSVSTLFEDIYDIASKTTKINDFSNALAIKNVKKSIFDAILCFFHKIMGKLVGSTAIYAVRNYSKKQIFLELRRKSQNRGFGYQPR